MFASCSSTIAVKINGGRTPVIHFRNNHTTATSYKHQMMRDQVCKTAEALAKAKLARTLRFALAADPISAMMRTSRSLPVTTQLVQVRGPQGCYSRVPEVVSVVCVERGCQRRCFRVTFCAASSHACVASSADCKRTISFKHFVIRTPLRAHPSRP